MSTLRVLSGSGVLKVLREFGIENSRTEAVTSRFVECSKMANGRP